MQNCFPPLAPQNLRVTMRSFPWAPVVFTTATTGQRTQQILSAAAKVGEEHRRRVSTGTLNQVIKDALSWKNPPTRNGRIGRVYYVTQAVRFAFAFVCDASRGETVIVRERALRGGLASPVAVGVSRAAEPRPTPARAPRPREQGVRPPTFVFFVNDPKFFTDTCGYPLPTYPWSLPPSPIARLLAARCGWISSPAERLSGVAVPGATGGGRRYIRYLERAIRENIGLKGTPIKLLFRGKAVVGTKAQAGTNEGPARTR